jgi:hypothetical protein
MTDDTIEKRIKAFEAARRKASRLLHAVADGADPKPLYRAVEAAYRAGNRLVGHEPSEVRDFRWAQMSAIQSRIGWAIQQGAVARQHARNAELREILGRAS